MKARYSSSKSKSKIKFPKQECFERRFRDEFKDMLSFFIHDMGTGKEKARSPYVTEFTARTVKSSLED